MEDLRLISTPRSRPTGYLLGLMFALLSSGDKILFKFSCFVSRRRLASLSSPLSVRPCSYTLQPATPVVKRLTEKISGGYLRGEFCQVSRGNKLGELFTAHPRRHRSLHTTLRYKLRANHPACPANFTKQPLPINTAKI